MHTERHGGSGGPLWEVNSIVRLRHCNTHMALHSHNDTFPLGNGDTQQEVTCFGGSDDNDRWQIKNVL